jgi:hypothetical protein
LAIKINYLQFFDVFYQGLSIKRALYKTALVSNYSGVRDSSAPSALRKGFSEDGKAAATGRRLAILTKTL